MKNEDKYSPDYVPKGYDPKKDNICLMPYDPNWLKIAVDEIAFLKTILPSNEIVDIQHVGSTAIPGMLAKPIIDLQIAVASLERIRSLAIKNLEENGYIYWYGNPEANERMLFIKGMPPFGERRTHHVHIVEPTSKHWTQKILFRDYLKAHPEKAKEYEKLKIDLAKKYEFDREKYTTLKSDFIFAVLDLAKNDGQST